MMHRGRYIKNYSVFLLSFLMILSNYRIVFANVGLNINKSEKLNVFKERIEAEKEDKQKEIETTIEQMISNKKKDYISKNYEQLYRADLELEYYLSKKAYKVVVISPFMLTKFNREGCFDSLLTNEEQWIVPISNIDRDKGYATLLDMDGKIEWVGTTFNENLNFMPYDIDLIFDKISTISNDFENIIYTYSHQYNLTMIYIKTSKEEYIIPFSGYEKQMRIENGKIYNLNDFLGILNTVFDESLLIKDDYIIGELPFRKFSLDIQNLVVLGNTFVLVILCFIISIEKKIIKYKTQ